MKKILHFPEGAVLPHMHNAINSSAVAAVESQKALISGAQTVKHLAGAVSGTVLTILHIGKAGVGMVKNVVGRVKLKTKNTLHGKKKIKKSQIEEGTELRIAA